MTSVSSKRVSDSGADLRSIVGKVFECFNKHDWQAMANLYALNALFRDPGFGIEPKFQNHDQIIAKYTELEKMFPDIHDEVTGVYPSGNEYVIVEFVSTGAAKNGLKLKLPICTIFKVEHGQITKDLTYYDNAQ